MKLVVNENALVFLKRSDWRLAKVINEIGELNVYGHSDPFFFLVREIVGQMISANVKKVIFSRLLDLCGGEITPQRLLEHDILEFRAIGLSMSKSSYILNLANEVNGDNVDFASLSSMPDDEVIKRLTAIKGIGKWTSKMYLIFFLRRDDVLPYEDGAFMQGFKWLYNYKNPSITTVERICKKWKPYTSLGARYLYAALDAGLTKTNVKDFLSKPEIGLKTGQLV